MHLLSARLVGVGPFEDVSVPFTDDAGRPRPVTVVHGGGGVGKTSLISGIAATRPGHAVAPPGSSSEEGTERTRFIECDWFLGHDDPERPHPLRVASPSLNRTEDELEAFRRREQALFDRRARQGGFAFAVIPAARWFSRQPIALSAPARTIARYDVRAQSSAEDGSRLDLTRETKQALAYATIAAALSEAGADRGRRLDLFGRAMRAAVDRLLSLVGMRYAGLDATSFEPMFADSTGLEVPFDLLPTRVRHLVAFAALPTRLLWAAHPGSDPLAMEGVVAIDEVDAHQDPAIQSGLVAALGEALPRVQWILTTTSPIVAGSSDTRDVVALRRLPRNRRVEMYFGFEARTH